MEIFVNKIRINTFVWNDVFRFGNNSQPVTDTIYIDQGSFHSDFDRWNIVYNL